MASTKAPSMTQQLRITVIVMALFALINLVVIHNQINGMVGDGRLVNYAGIVRGGTQRLTKLALFRQNTEAIVASLDEVLTGLANGSPDLQLVRVNDRDFQSKVQQIEQAWSSYKVTLQQFSGTSTAEMEARLLTESENHWELTNALVSSAEAFAKRHVETAKNVAVLLFLGNLAVLVTLWRLTRGVETRLKRTINTLTTSSTEISATTEQQEQITAQQASSVNETTATIDELEASCRQSAEHAEAAVIAAQQALLLTQKGNQAVSQTLEGMSALEEKVGAIAEQTLYLNEQANQINNISQLVSDLAHKTTMLALNSSVEAAHAGEHAKGFSVVVNEIRKLAEQSQKSAEKIGALVSEIQKAVQSTVGVTEEGTKTVAMGLEIAQKSTQTFAKISDAINQVVLNNQQISLNLRQQVDAMQQVVEAMNTINRGSKETAAGIGQTRIGIQQLNESALTLKQMV